MVPLFRFIHYFGLAVILSGCWAATIPHEVPQSLGDPDMLEPLIGQHYEKVIEVLGSPDQLLSHGDNRYMMYQTLGDGTDIVFLIWIPLPVLDLGDEHNNSALHCLRFDIDNDDKVRNYKIKSGGWAKRFSVHNKLTRCREFFWSKEEMASIKSTTDFVGGWREIDEQQEIAKIKELTEFKKISLRKPNEALVSLCKAADLGNQEARVILGDIFKHGGYMWLKEGVVERNYKLAYVWYALSGWYDQEDLRHFADRYLTSKRQLEARKSLEEWQPGNCERSLGLTEEVS